MLERLLEQQVRYNKVHKELNELYHNVALQFGLSDASSIILYTLYISEKPCSQKELCELWSLTKTTVNSALRKLIKSEYVALSSDPTNYKVKLARLTKSGEALAEKSARPLFEAELKAFERLTEEEQEQLAVISKKHVKLLREEIGNAFDN